MVTWVTAVQLLLVISSTVAVEEKESFESYFQNFFQRHHDKVPRAIPAAGPQNAVHTPKALPAQQVPVKSQPAPLVTPSLQSYNYQLPVPVPQYAFLNLPQSVQYQKLLPPTPKYTTAYIPQYQPQIAVRSPGVDASLKFRPEEAIKSFNPSFQPLKEQPPRQYNFSPSLQTSKEESSHQYSFIPVKEPTPQYKFSASKEQPTPQYKFSASKEQPTPQYKFSATKEQPSRQYSFTVRQAPKEEQRQFEKYPAKEYSSSKKPSYREDEYYYKGSDQGTHEHVKVKSSHTHKKQTTGGTEDYYDGDYGDYDGKRGYRSLDGI